MASRRLLYVKCSPRGARSHSVRVADAFVAAWKNRNRDGIVESLDLFEADIPPFDGPAVSAKFAVMRGESPSAADRAIWGKVIETIRVFTSADAYVFAVPMWNFGIPYRLKQYLDVIIQPGLTFSFSPSEGYKGLVTGKPALAVYARGGSYGPGSGMEAYDFQRKYLEAALGFIGFTDIRSIEVEPTLAEGPEAAKAAEAAAMAKAAQMAATF
ncbi:MAG: NAD(P)H-dependent oxidoreductase [Planctomycetota bacterium]|nr:NAD(P)H-dependent oxidoreductase [Planctomycetota bacterium]